MKDFIQKLASVNGTVTISNGILAFNDGSTADMKAIQQPRVLIVVSGGVADWVCDDGVDVEKFDFDDYDDEDNANKIGVPVHFADLAESVNAPVQSG